MFVALIDGAGRMAEPGLHATCPGCGEPVIPKCGEIVSWHWAHLADTDCAHAGGSYGESAWHLSWKKYARPENTEVAQTRGGETHQADIIVSSGPEQVAVEVQYSAIDVREIGERERFWGSIRWIFYIGEREHEVGEADARFPGSPYVIRVRRGWSEIVAAHAGIGYLMRDSVDDERKPLASARKTGRVYIDLGANEVFVVNKVNQRGTWASGDIIPKTQLAKWIAGIDWIAHAPFDPSIAWLVPPAYAHGGS